MPRRSSKVLLLVPCGVPRRLSDILLSLRHDRSQGRFQCRVVKDVSSGERLCWIDPLACGHECPQFPQC